MEQAPKTTSKDKVDTSAAADIATAFSDSFGGKKPAAKQASADTQCSFEPFCKGKVVSWKPKTKSTFAPSTFKKVLNHSTKNRDGVEKFLCHQDVNVMQFAKNYCQIIVRNLFWKNNAHMLVYVVICTRLGSPASWAMFFSFF